MGGEEHEGQVKNADESMPTKRELDLEAMLRYVLNSARPNPTEHPAMHEAWTRGPVGP